MKAFIAFLIALGWSAGATAATDYSFANTPNLYCGGSSTGRCIVYADAGQSFEYFWYWNGNAYSPANNAQITVRDSTGATVAVYGAKINSNPRSGMNNLVLTDSLGIAVTVSYTGHTASVLHRSGHNYYTFYTYIDAGTLTE